VLAGVARGARLVDDIQQGVVVAVHEHPSHLLDVPRGVTLLPELVPAPAPVRGELRLHGRLDSFAVCVGQHQDLAGLRLLGHDWDQSVPLRKVDLVYLRRLQGNSLTVRSARGEGNKECERFKAFKRRTNNKCSLEVKLNLMIRERPSFACLHRQRQGGAKKQRILLRAFGQPHAELPPRHAASLKRKINGKSTQESARRNLGTRLQSSAQFGLASVIELNYELPSSSKWKIAHYALG